MIALMFVHLRAPVLADNAQNCGVNCVLVTLTGFALVEVLNAEDSAELSKCSSAVFQCTLCFTSEQSAGLLEAFVALLLGEISSKILKQI